jgi:hypothetical protein
MANPIYKGQGQPASASGGWLSGLFGTQTPAYKSAPPVPASTTSASASTSTSGSGSAATAPSALAPPVAPAVIPTGCDADGIPSFAIVIPREVIER